MNFIDKIISICSISTDKIDSANEDYQRATVLNFYSIVSITLFVVIGIISLIDMNISTIIAMGMSLVVVGANYLAFKSKANFKISGYVFSVTLLLLLIWFLYSGKVNNQGILLYTLYPALIILLLGKKRGNNLSLAFFILTTTAILLPKVFSFDLSFTLSNQILFVLLYIAFFIFLNIYENLLGIRASEFNVKIQKAKHETQAKEEFISKISHQIRTPLNNLVVVTNIVNTFDLDEKLKDMVDTIQASTNNLVNVVNNIAEISNVDLLQSKDYNQNFNLETTIRNTISLFSTEDSDNLEFPVHISDDLNYHLFGDPVKIKQVYLNLIENLLKKTKSGKNRIDIVIKPTNETYEITEIIFSISTRDIEQISDITKIQNTEKTKKGKNAAIIKLLEFNIANRIIESLGGTLDFDISTDKFAFSFILKFKKGELFAVEQEKAKEFALPEIESQEKVSLKDATVLLVEDNLINQKIVLLSLKKAVKNVEVANNGKEALDMFGSAKYDVILMDIQMPIMNGIVTTKKIRSIENSTNTHTPIIAITANALLGDKEECLAAGMDDYISKPFQIETLITKMQKQLS